MDINIDLTKHLILWIAVFVIGTLMGFFILKIFNRSEKSKRLNVLFSIIIGAFLLLLAIFGFFNWIFSFFE